MGLQFDEIISCLFKYKAPCILLIGAQFKYKFITSINNCLKNNID